MQRLIHVLKYFLKTCIQQPSCRNCMQLRFSIQIKRRLVVIVDVHMQFSHNNSKLMMISCIKYMNHEQYFVNVLMSLDHDYAMFWCTIFLHYILLYYPIIQNTSRIKQYLMNGIKQSKYFSFEESLLVRQAVDWLLKVECLHQGILHS